MIRKPDVILLDEATSALDNENEAKVQEALDKLARQGSALIIAHRLSTVMDSDKIVVVDHGQVLEEGRVHSATYVGLCTSTAP
jgi:ATP-binding cassette subfamily C protein